MPTKKGEYRILTPGEITIVTSIFQDAIDVTSVKVYNKKFFPMQSKNTAVTPNGNLYWPVSHFREDYSITEIWRIHWFMHEMVHVWQYQMGMRVKLRGLGSFMAEYEYELKEGQPLPKYSMEQQAGIIADYYLLRDHGYQNWVSYSKEKNKRASSGSSQSPLIFWLDIYKKTLATFLQDPKDKAALFK